MHKGILGKWIGSGRAEGSEDWQSWPTGLRLWLNQYLYLGSEDIYFCKPLLGLSRMGSSAFSLTSDLVTSDQLLNWAGILPLQGALEIYGEGAYQGPTPRVCDSLYNLC